MVLFMFRISFRSFNLDMSSYLFALHICHVLSAYLAFPVFCFFSIGPGVDVSDDIKIDYTDDNYSAEQGKHSPLISNPSF